MAQKIFAIISAIVIYHYGGGVQSLDENQFKEIKMNEIDPEIDMKWFGSVKSWYGPMWSKLDRARGAVDTFDKPISEITNEEWNTPACSVFDQALVFTAWGRKVKFDCQPIIEGSKMMGLNCKALRPGAESVKIRFRLTNNKSFALIINEWEDGEASWAAVSTTPTLKKEDKKRILFMVKALGFKDDMIFEEDYANCKLDREEL